MSADKVNIAKLVKLLTGDKKIEQIANVIDKVQIKDSEQIREIVPAHEWVSSDYYIGRDGNSKLYPFWKDLICDIFDDNSGQKYTTVVLTGGIGCRPVDSTYYETSLGLLNLSEIKSKLDNDEELYINTENGCEKIIDAHVIGEKDVVTLKLSDGTTFSGSSDHLLKVFDGCNIVFKKISDITDNDQILKSNKPKIEFTNNNYSLNEAYVAGSILGDGTMSVYGAIRFSWDDVREGADNIEAAFRDVFPTANVRKRVKGTSDWHYRHNEWGAALNDFQRAVKIDPECEAKNYIDLIQEILAFRYKDIYNP